jgi:hypothetical protein
MRSLPDGSDVDDEALDMPPSHPTMQFTVRRFAAQALRAATVSDAPVSGALAELSPDMILEPLPAGFSFTSKASWAFVKTGVSTLRTAQAICDFAAAQNAMVRLKIRSADASASVMSGATSIKLCAVFGGDLRWDVRLWDASRLAGVAGTHVPRGAGILVDVSRVSGDSLGSKFAFAKLASALAGSAILLPSDTTDPAYVDDAASAAAQPLQPPALGPVLPSRERTTFASDALELL